jgi:hypothetical protein
MRQRRPLLVSLPLVPGILIGVWIGTGSGQGTAPSPRCSSYGTGDVRFLEIRRHCAWKRCPGRIGHA